MAKSPERIGIENLLTIQRLGNKLNRDARQALRPLFDQLAALILSIDPAAPGREVFRLSRVAKLLDRADKLTAETFSQWERDLRLELAAIGVQQTGIASSMLAATIGPNVVRVSTEGITLNYFKRILDSRPFEGETLSGWVGRQKQATMRRLGQQLRLGVVNNETVDQLVDRVIGRRVGRGRTGGILGVTEREAETIVRTGVNEITNRAHMATYEENDDITKEYEYVATLDSRTTLICARLDGQVFRYDDPQRKEPPQHPNCRSTIVPVVDWEGLGLEPPPEGTRASAGGQVPASTTYQQWLLDQPKSVQNEILGPARANLFRERKITLRDLVRSDNSIVTLEQLGAS